MFLVQAPESDCGTMWCSQELSTSGKIKEEFYQQFQGVIDNVSRRDNDLMIDDMKV
jgi:hypothetical protein